MEVTMASCGSSLRRLITVSKRRPTAHETPREKYVNLMRLFSTLMYSCYWITNENDRPICHVSTCGSLHGSLPCGSLPYGSPRGSPCGSPRGSPRGSPPIALQITTQNKCTNYVTKFRRLVGTTTQIWLQVPGCKSKTIAAAFGASITRHCYGFFSSSCPVLASVSF